MGSQVEDQQVGCLWQGSYLLSVSLSGAINYLDVNNPSKPLRVLRVRLHACSTCMDIGMDMYVVFEMSFVQGQNKNLSSIATSQDESTVYAGSIDGRINILS